MGRGFPPLGCAQDFAERELSRVLEQVKTAHRGLHLRVKVDSTRVVTEACGRGELDLGLILRPPGGPGRVIGPAPLVWLAAPGWQPPAGPLPPVLFDAPCGFRDAALGALDEAGIAWEVLFTTPSLAGALAAVRAGVGVTVRTGRAVAEGVVVHRGLPALSPLELALLRGGDSASSAVSCLADLLEQVVRDSGPG